MLPGSTVVCSNSLQFMLSFPRVRAERKSRKQAPHLGIYLFVPSLGQSLRRWPKNWFFFPAWNSHSMYLRGWPAGLSDCRTAQGGKRLTHQALVVWQHDDDLCVVIPDHSPEIFSCVWQRMLGYDELVTPVVALLQQNKPQLLTAFNSFRALILSLGTHNDPISFYSTIFSHRL